MQNVYHPNGMDPHRGRFPHRGDGIGPPKAPSNTCYVQFGTEVKKLSLPLETALIQYDGKHSTRIAT